MKYEKFSTDNEDVVNHPAINDCLVVDIETDSLDVDAAKIKFFGGYSYKYKSYFICNEHERDKMQQLINEHRILIGYNNAHFDCPIMSNVVNMLNVDYKIIFDCYSVLYKNGKPNREDVIKHNGKQLSHLIPDRKLKSVLKALGLRTNKGEIDYNLFKKDKLSPDELKEIINYLRKDLSGTRELFEFYVSYFKPFAKYVNVENVMKFDYVRSSMGSYTYSVICNLAGFDLEFNEYNPFKKPENHGGLVLEPVIGHSRGKIYCVDFQSFYPHVMMQCNLYSPVSNGREGWSGGSMFPDLRGTYANDKMGKIERVLQNVYQERLRLKTARDPSELALKYVINTIYGISGSSVFKHVFNETTSGDCTYVGRTCLKLLVDEIEKNGMKVIYGDTDSCFVHTIHKKTPNARENLMAICENVINKIKANVPFPVPTFSIGCDEVINDMWIIGKKNYVALTNDNQITIKGLPIMKRNSSELGRKIFNTLKPQIIERRNVKFPLSYVQNLIDEEISRDASVLGQLYVVKNPEAYKSPTSLQYQISKSLGEGSHVLIPNKTLGSIGKSKKYCTIEEMKENNLNFDDLFLDKVYNELDPFIDKNDNQTELSV